MADLFAGLEPFKLTQVQLTDRKLGHGSYATVFEVIYNGKKCAGKEIHKILLEQGDTSYTLRRFEEECHILSCLHHPNIVQFYGVYFREKERVPILVMEFLPMNLTSCIEERGILPEEISYSILHGVALGLCYLHNQDHPIIHRDLSANNVLLTYDMKAKISDFGVARMLDLTPLQFSHMTQIPGTPAYMPPEVMVANPIYDTSVDEFSFGVMMIHVFSGKWPEPQCSQIRMEADKMIPVSEAERRDVFLQAIGYNHPLMKLILKCISNNPKQRVHIDVILKMLEVVQQISVGEKKAMSRAYGADLSNSVLLKEGVRDSNNEDHETMVEETADYSIEGQREGHERCDEKQNIQETKHLTATSGITIKTTPATMDSDCGSILCKDISLANHYEPSQTQNIPPSASTQCQVSYHEVKSKKESSSLPEHSKARSTISMSAIAEGFGHLKDDFMDIKSALPPKLHKLTDFISHAASSLQQKSYLSVGDPSADRDVQTLAAITIPTVTDWEEQQRRSHMIEAAEQDEDFVVVTTSPPQAKKHCERQGRLTDKQSFSARSSRSVSPVDQLYLFDEDLPCLTPTQPQEAEHRSIVQTQHYGMTSSSKVQEDVEDRVTCSTSFTTNSIETTHKSTTQAIQSNLADTYYSSSAYQHPQSLSLPQISDMTLGSSAPEFTNTMSPKQQDIVPKADEYYEESTTSVSDSDNGAYLEESQVGADWFRLCGSQVLHSQMIQQQKRQLDSSPPSLVYDSDQDFEPNLAEETELSPTANIWVPISLPSQHNLQCVCLSDKLLWGIDSVGSVYCMTMDTPHGQNQLWRNVKGNMHQISSSSSGSNVWGVYGHNAYVRLGIGMSPQGNLWRNVTSNTHYAHKIKQIAADETVVWAISTNGKILFRRDVGQPYPEGKAWQEVGHDSESTQENFVFVACCRNIVWAVTTSGKVLCRSGISYHMPSGRKWKKVKVPKLVSISITSGGMVWGVSEDNSTGFRCGVSASKPSGKGPWWEICIDALNTAPVVSHDGISIFETVSSFVDSLPLLGLNNFLSVSASSVSGVVVLDQKGRHLHTCRRTVTGFHYTPASNSDQFQSVSWSKIAAGSTALWLTTSIDGELYCLTPDETLIRVECPDKVDQIAASPLCMWIMSKDGIWSRQMLSTKDPEGITFDRIELSAELQCTQLRHIACGEHSAWAIDCNGAPHFQFGIQPQESGIMSPAWIPLEDNLHPLKRITVSPNDCLVWACDENHNVYARVGVTTGFPVGQKWELIPGERAKELCAENSKIYALTQNGELICRFGISQNNVQGNYWRKMPGRFEHITVGESRDVWAVDASGKVWKQDWMVVTVANSQVAKSRETMSDEISTTSAVPSDQSDWELL